MYQAIAYFSYQNFEQDPVTLIDQIVNQWRINGQVIGREIGVTHHQTQTHSSFQVRVAIPEQDSLLPNWNSENVSEALVQAEEANVYFEYFEVVGRDYNAEQTSEMPATFYILYTTHLDTCSPIYNGVTFCPVPLYRAVQHSGLNEKIIQWQEDWQACDQLQMNGNILEQQALSQISEVESELSQQGRKIAQAIEIESQIPTYYYLYRLGKDSEIEHNRKCPSCNQGWKLAEPFAIFQFKCDQCRLVSNLSWEIQ
ncbi:hypothetical protein A6B43_07790 [Vespertiliibacter pulmonis]|uniref:Putative nucleic acid-binding Zn ribbon protein n=1 Tax=Vespertiliibacter pulmonis TaxID=1443036 RepID=A0A3N4W3U5_9PAST|nr:Zn-ribbon-containing protein [Vespertiliibacter pulmonis]QLB21426.1 hypothetical protein A6B43_07790 [Vespertiliibacter pulmonis]RPE85841.1 putative nucleic acid-binding Zn ribbon protein [Vespertiliibacter pulmonis]